MANSIDVSLILPALNEEAGVRACISKAHQIFSLEGISGEILVVDNGSTDRTALFAQEMGARVLFESVRGYGAACQRGFLEARGEFVVLVDADNSYEILDLPRLLSSLSHYKDLVFGSRFLGDMQPGSMSLFRYVGNTFLRGMLSLRGVRTQETCTGFIAFRREILSRLSLRHVGMEFSTEFMIAAHRERLRISEVPITFHPRAGESKFNELFDPLRHLRLLFLPI